MTSDTRDLTTRPAGEQPRPDRIQLSPVQVAASALASVSAAVIASLFGVAGTIVGAGLVSVIATTGSAVYSSSMRRTSAQLRRARETLAARAATSQQTTGGGTSLLEATAPAVSRSRRSRAIRAEAGGAPDKTSRWRRGFLTVGSGHGLRWPALVGSAVLVFVLAIAAVTVFELIAQEPVSALTGHRSSSTTTLGSLGSGSTKAAPKPTSTPTATSTSTSTSGSGSSVAPTAGVGTSASPSAGSGSGSSGSGSSATPSAAATPTTQPSVKPSASAAPSASPGSGSTSGGGGGSTDSDSGSSSGSGTSSGG